MKSYSYATQSGGATKSCGLVFTYCLVPCVSCVFSAAEVVTIMVRVLSPRRQAHFSPRVSCVRQDTCVSTAAVRYLSSRICLCQEIKTLSPRVDFHPVSRALLKNGNYPKIMLITLVASIHTTATACDSVSTAPCATATHLLPSRTVGRN